MDCSSRHCERLWQEDPKFKPSLGNLVTQRDSVSKEKMKGGPGDAAQLKALASISSAENSGGGRRCPGSEEAVGILSALCKQWRLFEDSGKGARGHPGCNVCPWGEEHTRPLLQESCGGAVFLGCWGLVKTLGSLTLGWGWAPTKLVPLAWRGHCALGIQVEFN